MFYLHLCSIIIWKNYVINLDLFIFSPVSFTLMSLSLSVPLGESVTDVLHINMLYVNLHACHLPCTHPPLIWICIRPALVCVFVTSPSCFSFVSCFSQSRSHFPSHILLLALVPVCVLSIAFSRTSELLVLSLSTYCKCSTCLQWQILEVSTLGVWSMCFEHKQKRHGRRKMQCVCCLFLVVCCFYWLF